MTSEQRNQVGRRTFLRRGAVVTAAAGAGTVVGGTLMANAVSGAGAPVVGQAAPPLSDAVNYLTLQSVRLMATDGHISFPGRRHSITDPAAAHPVYAVGFRTVDNQLIEASGGELNLNPGKLIEKYKGKVMHTAPTIVAIEGEEMGIVITNLGLATRPDLADGHSLHWHGFRNATAVFDGVPETSISVPFGRDLPYFFDLKTKDEPGQTKGSAGTYMYHCHFEDTEHVQMGMTGVVFVEPRDMWFDMAGNNIPRRKVAYNDNPAGIDSSFDREFALLVNEIDTHPHDNLENIQEFVWSNYKANYWTINGRSYPDTVVPQITPREVVADPVTSPYQELLDMPAVPVSADEKAEAEMYYQQNSSLVQCRAGDRVLLRLASLGYEIHSLELSGINDMQIIAHDASLLMGKSGTSDLTYKARRIELGPGEGRDAIFTAPAYDNTTAEDDDLGLRAGKTRRFNRYLLKSRNNSRMHNNGGVDATDGVAYAGAKSTYGGMVTEIWVYPSDTDPEVLGAIPAQHLLPEQISVNETFPTLVVPNGHV